MNLGIGRAPELILVMGLEFIVVEAAVAELRHLGELDDEVGGVEVLGSVVA